MTSPRQRTGMHSVRTLLLQRGDGGLALDDLAEAEGPAHERSLLLGDDRADPVGPVHGLRGRRPDLAEDEELVAVARRRPWARTAGGRRSRSRTAGPSRPPGAGGGSRRAPSSGGVEPGQLGQRRHGTRLRTELAQGSAPPPRRGSPAAAAGGHGVDAAEVEVAHGPAGDGPAGLERGQRVVGPARARRARTSPSQCSRGASTASARARPWSTTAASTWSSAVRMRLLPPLPRTSRTSPSASTTIDGAIIDATRSPAGAAWKPGRVQVVLAHHVVGDDAGAGHAPSPSPRRSTSSSWRRCPRRRDAHVGGAAGGPPARQLARHRAARPARSSVATIASASATAWSTEPVGGRPARPAPRAGARPRATSSPAERRRRVGQQPVAPPRHRQRWLALTTA